MGNKIDLAGKKFGRLTVIRESDKRSGKEILWECTCECGNAKLIMGKRLRNGETRSCGCLQMETMTKHIQDTTKDLTGKKFGSLTVLERSGVRVNKKTMWVCQCDCGNKSVVATSNLTNGHIKHCQQCGYKALAEKRTTHGKRRTKLYTKWCSMRRRCEEMACKSYKDYGAKGIRVCEEWHDPQKFFDWAMENGYQEGFEIDRIDPKGDYCPENCRFVTRLVNANNKTSNHYVTYNGETKSIADMCRKYGLAYKKAYPLIYKGVEFSSIVKMTEKEAAAMVAEAQEEQAAQQPKDSSLFGEE